MTMLLDAAETEPGLRERKKLQTRQALVRAALDLFSERGVDATTVDDIADAVNVSARTFHRYFPAKEDVLFADSVARQERFARFLRDRSADEPLLDTLRDAANDLAQSFLADRRTNAGGCNSCSAPTHCAPGASSTRTG